MKRKQRYMERGLTRDGLGQAADRALRNYQASGLILPDDTMIRSLAMRVKARAWDAEPPRAR